MDEEKRVAATLRLSKSGPIRVSGEFYIVDTQGNDLTPENTGNGDVFLCACGQSQKKPFCDGSHGKHNGR